jgi:hypothetical protein
VFVDFEERCFDPRKGHVLVRRPRDGFVYHFQKENGGIVVFMFAEFVRSHASKRTDEELAADLLESSQLMVERFVWQQRLGRYRETFPHWIPRTLRKGTIATGLVRSQVGEIDRVMMSGSGGYELVVQSPRCDEGDWLPLWARVDALLEGSKTLTLEDAGYIVPKRTFEFVLTGSQARLKAFIPKLKPIFTGRPGTIAALRKEDSEAKGKEYKLA